MSAYLVWRLVKLIAFVLWGAGIFSLVKNASQKENLRTLYFLIVPSFAMVWVAGWLMMKLTGRTMTEPWISYAIVFSLLSLGASFQVAHQHTFQKLTKLIAVLGFSMGTSVMVFRQAEQTLNGIGVSAAIGLILGFLLQKEVEETKTDLATIEKGFTWVAWAEGLTVLVLFGLFMPFKYLLEINLDAGTGVIGWTHGVLVILYVITLTYTKIAFKWSWLDWFIGGVVSFFPFGTFWFERRMRAQMQA
jgi:integral membrane protein